MVLARTQTNNVAAPSRGCEPIVSPSGAHFPFGKMGHDVLKLNTHQHAENSWQTSGSPEILHTSFGVVVAM